MAPQNRPPGPSAMLPCGCICCSGWRHCSMYRPVGEAGSKTLETTTSTQFANGSLHVLLPSVHVRTEIKGAHFYTTRRFNTTYSANSVVTCFVSGCVWSSVCYVLGPFYEFGWHAFSHQQGPRYSQPIPKIVGCQPFRRTYAQLGHRTWCLSQNN